MRVQKLLDSVMVSPANLRIATYMRLYSATVVIGRINRESPRLIRLEHDDITLSYPIRQENDTSVDVSSKSVINAKSALSWKQKRTVLTQEVL